MRHCGVLSSVVPGWCVRNGPNPQFLPKGPYHLLDGNGMLHAIRIKEGKATLYSHYIKAYKYTIENEAGQALIPNVFFGFNTLMGSAARGSLTAARVVSGQYIPVNDIGLANTSLALFCNHLFALRESDLPYKVRVTETDDIETMGHFEFEGKLAMSMIVHPKIDGETGKTFAFCYSPISSFLTYFWFDKEGRKQANVPKFSNFDSGDGGGIQNLRTRGRGFAVNRELS
ncbi:hypothetical protein HN51_058129 [Arachis hypogaea]|uniref:probable carotenoid cleavage dioxygenase 4, chloroplastic n=1 Tax=Arachis hypogaea TaxID=3818 RepID=UPI00110570BC|nr:probable carotenoid cleavage dioxygenase 4, chloroplastic [Arachis hypogaea]